MTDGRRLAAPERRVLFAAAVLVLALAIVGFRWPRALAWPVAGLCAWLAVGLVARSLSFARKR